MVRAASGEKLRYVEPTPTPPPQAPVRSGFVRRADERLIAGVAGGIADVFGVEAIWVRVAFVAAAFVGGLGILTYLLMWWLVRREDLPQSAGQRFAEHFPDAPAWVGVGLLMLGAVLLAGQLGLWAPSIGWAFLLIGLGVVLFRRSTERLSSDGDRQQPELTRTVPLDPVPPRPTRRHRERSYLGWLALGLAIATVGAILMLRSSGRIHPSNAQLFAIPLAILGLALLVGSFVGQARALILLGVVLVPMTLVATMLPVPITGRWDPQSFHLRRAGQLRPEYRQAGGPLEITMTEAATNGISTPIRAVLDVGEIWVTVTGDRPVVLHARMGLGSIEFFGQSVGGIGLEQTFRDSTGDGRPPLVLELEAGFGHIEVLRRGRLPRAVPIA